MAPDAYNYMHCTPALLLSSHLNVEMPHSRPTSTGPYTNLDTSESVRAHRRFTRPPTNPSPPPPPPPPAHQPPSDVARPEERPSAATGPPTPNEHDTRGTGPARAAPLTMTRPPSRTFFFFRPSSEPRPDARFARHPTIVPCPELAPAYAFYYQLPHRQRRLTGNKPLISHRANSPDTPQALCRPRIYSACALAPHRPQTTPPTPYLANNHPPPSPPPYRPPPPPACQRQYVTSSHTSPSISEFVCRRSLGTTPAPPRLRVPRPQCDVFTRAERQTGPRPPPPPRPLATRIIAWTAQGSPRPRYRDAPAPHRTSRIRAMSRLAAPRPGYLGAPGALTICAQD